MESNQPKVLLVDSQTRLVHGIAQELQTHGIELLLAADAPNAFAEARRCQPSAVVINGEHEGCDVMFLVERIRANLQTAGLPVIVFTPRGGAIEQQFLAARVQECIAPPLTAEVIRAAVHRHMLEPPTVTQAPAAVLEQPDRLAALYETALLDSAPEESFDRLTRMASHLLGASTALVSLVDKDRQFFKSQVGLAQPWSGARQTRLTHSFCQWVVSGKDQVVIEDANEDAVLRSNLAVRDMGVIAYAGVPLSGRDGQAIGSFCAIESKRRAWTEEDIETLRDLAQVSEAYAVLDQARRCGTTPSARMPENLRTSIHVAGKAIIGVVRILRRYGARLRNVERDDLLSIVDEQSAHLLALAPRAH